MGIEFKLHTSGDQWYFDINELDAKLDRTTLATSERYHSKSDAVNAAKFVIDHAGGAVVSDM